MPVREARVQLERHRGECLECGHPRLVAVTRPQGPGCRWYTYCPSCRRVHEQADIPGWFGRDLLAPHGMCALH
ncbi:MAG: hypothetical protein SCH98_15685 [Deferrisomatales bacterium]|nr:hypothetical protein [Deferrisomatales bacterium]